MSRVRSTFSEYICMKKRILQGEEEICLESIRNEDRFADDFDNQPVHQFFFARLLGSMFSRLNNQ